MSSSREEGSGGTRTPSRAGSEPVSSAGSSDAEEASSSTLTSSVKKSVLGLIGRNISHADAPIAASVGKRSSSSSSRHVVHIDSNGDATIRVQSAHSEGEPPLELLANAAVTVVCAAISQVYGQNSRFSVGGKIWDAQNVFRDISVNNDCESVSDMPQGRIDGEEVGDEARGDEERFSLATGIDARLFRMRAEKGAGDMVWHKKKITTGEDASPSVSPNGFSDKQTSSPEVLSRPPDETAARFGSGVFLMHGGKNSVRAPYVCGARDIPAPIQAVVALLRDITRSQAIDNQIVPKSLRVVAQLDSRRRVCYCVRRSAFTRKPREHFWLESAIHRAASVGSLTGGPLAPAITVLTYESAELDGLETPIHTKGTTRDTIDFAAFIVVESGPGRCDVFFVSVLEPRLSLPSIKITERVKAEFARAPLRIKSFFASAILDIQGPSNANSSSLGSKFRKNKFFRKLAGPGSSSGSASASSSVPVTGSLLSSSPALSDGYSAAMIRRAALAYIPQGVVQAIFARASSAENVIACPRAEPFDGALFFLDISGYTQLTEMVTNNVAEQNEQTVGAEIVRDVLCEYFGLLLDCIDRFEGDVCKFAGDALMAVFPQKADRQPSDCMLSAILCAQQACLIEYAPAESETLRRAHGDVNALSGLRLSNRVAIAYGEMLNLHVGDSQRVEFMVAGQPLLQIDPAISAAHTKTVVCSPEAWTVCVAHSLCDGVAIGEHGCMQISHVNSLSSSSQLETGSSKRGSSQNLLNHAWTSRSATSMSPAWCSVCDEFVLAAEGAHCSNCKTVRHIFCRLASPLCLGDKAKVLKSLNDSDSFIPDTFVANEVLRYIPRPARPHEDAGVANSPLIQRNKRYANEEPSMTLDAASFAAEIRTATILFVGLPDVRPDRVDCPELMQAAVATFLSMLNKYHGILRQAIIDDKGAVMIGVFGLPPVIADVPGCEVLTAVEVATSLKRDHQLSCTIGIATGRVFCGIVGNAVRHEYAVVGDVVNLSARLMGAALRECGPKKAKRSNRSSRTHGFMILCDSTTFALSTGAGVSFSRTLEISVKGKAAALRVYQPNRVQSVLSSSAAQSKRKHTVSLDEFTRTTLGRLRSRAVSSPSEQASDTQRPPKKDHSRRDKDPHAIDSGRRSSVKDKPLKRSEDETIVRKTGRERDHRGKKPSRHRPKKPTAETNSGTKERDGSLLHVTASLGRPSTSAEESSGSLPDVSEETVVSASDHSRTEVKKNQIVHADTNASSQSTSDCSDLEADGQPVVDWYFGDTSRFCGREKELQILDSAFDRFLSAEQESGCILLEGEQGFGKSSLVAGFISETVLPERLTQDHILFVAVFCSQLTENIPYKAVRDFFDATILGDGPEERCSRALQLFDICSSLGVVAPPEYPTAVSSASSTDIMHQHELRELAPLLIEVGIPFGQNDVIGHLDAAFRAQALRQLVLALMLGLSIGDKRSSSKGQKLLIVCEDSHWMDHESVRAFADAISFSGRGKSIRPSLFLVVLLRSIEHLRPQQQQLFVKLRKHPKTEFLALAGMQDAEIMSVASHICSAFVLDAQMHRDEVPLEVVGEKVLSLLASLGAVHGWSQLSADKSSVPTDEVASRNCYNDVQSRLELSEDARAVLLSRSGGSPLFCVEFLRHVLQQGFFAFTLCGPLKAQRIRVAPVNGAETLKQMEQVPLTLEKLVVSRIDRLSAPAQQVLKAASVFGVEFCAFPDLENVLPANVFDGLGSRRQQIQFMLRHTLSEFVTTLSDDAGSRRSLLRFSHTIIQEVVYGLLTSQLRREWHKKVALMYESQQRALQPRAEIMAFHWRRAGNFRRACLYYASAARHAHHNAAKVESQFWVNSYFEVVDECDPPMSVDERAPLHFLRGKLLRSMGDAVGAAKDFMVCVNTVVPEGLNIGTHLRSSTIADLVAAGERSCDLAFAQAAADASDREHGEKQTDALHACCSELLEQDQDTVLKRRRANDAAMQSLAFLGSDMMLAAFKSAEFAHEVPTQVQNTARSHLSHDNMDGKVVAGLRSLGSVKALRRQASEAATKSNFDSNTFCFIVFLCLRSAILSTNMGSLATAYGAARFLPGSHGKKYESKLQVLIKENRHLLQTHGVWHVLSQRWYDGDYRLDALVTEAVENVIVSCMEFHDAGHVENLLVRITLWHMYGCRLEMALVAARRCSELSQRRSQKAHHECGHRLEVITLYRHGAIGRAWELDKIAERTSLTTINEVAVAHARIRTLAYAVFAHSSASYHRRRASFGSDVSSEGSEDDSKVSHQRQSSADFSSASASESPLLAPPARVGHRRRGSSALVGSEEWSSTSKRVKAGKAKAVLNTTARFGYIPIKDAEEPPTALNLMQCVAALPHRGLLALPTLDIAVDMIIHLFLESASQSMRVPVALMRCLRAVMLRVRETHTLFSAMSMSLRFLEPTVAFLAGWIVWLKQVCVAEQPSASPDGGAGVGALRAPAAAVAEWKRGLKVCVSNSHGKLSPDQDEVSEANKTTNLADAADTKQPDGVAEDHWCAHLHARHQPVFMPFEHAKLLLSIAHFSADHSTAELLSSRETADRLLSEHGLVWPIDRRWLACLPPRQQATSN